MTQKMQKSIQKRGKEMMKSIKTTLHHYKASLKKT